MLAHVDQSFETLLQRARADDTVALGCLLDIYRPYLKLIAASLLRTASCASVDVSDVVQETNLNACRGFPGFVGSKEPQLVLWLRRTLVNHVLTLRKKRGVLIRRPESLEALLHQMSEKIHDTLASQGSTPSAKASRREQAVLVANALESLPPDYKQVLVLCYLDKVPHEEVGRLMGRSEKASRMLLMRAARALEDRLGEGS
jgi:RNA polymerase sigma-70 factor (ECF subfamily)